jgi:hypothetical protein
VPVVMDSGTASGRALSPARSGFPYAAGAVGTRAARLPAVPPRSARPGHGCCASASQVLPVTRAPSLADTHLLVTATGLGRARDQKAPCRVHRDRRFRSAGARFQRRFPAPGTAAPLSDRGYGSEKLRITAGASGGGPVPGAGTRQIPPTA